MTETQTSCYNNLLKVGIPADWAAFMVVQPEEANLGGDFTDQSDALWGFAAWGEKTLQGQDFWINVARRYKQAFSTPPKEWLENYSVGG